MFCDIYSNLQVAVGLYQRTGNQNRYYLQSVDSLEKDVVIEFAALWVSP